MKKDKKQRNTEIRGKREIHIENQCAAQFRKWTNQIVKDCTIQGWTMDAERIKYGGNLTDEFFEYQLKKIREIRLSEREFYQKITDIYAQLLTQDSDPLRIFLMKVIHCTAP